MRCCTMADNNIDNSDLLNCNIVEVLYKEFGE